MLRILDSAPNFKLQSTKGEVELSSYFTDGGTGGGRWVVLFFYSGDFTSVCTTEVPEFARRYSEFVRLNSEVLGVSADSLASHMAWIRHLGIAVGFPLLSDFKKDVCREYDILDEKSGEPQRGTYIIDPSGRIRFKMIIDPNLGQNVDEVFRVLQALQTGKECPVNWRPGTPTLT